MELLLSMSGLCVCVCVCVCVLCEWSGEGKGEAQSHYVNTDSVSQTNRWDELRTMTQIGTSIGVWEVLL